MSDPKPNIPTKPAHKSRLKQWLYITIFHADTPAGKLFDVVLLVLILLSITVISLETIATVQAQYKQELRVLEWVFTILFTIEYLLRLYSARNRRRYIFSFFGLVDLISIIPTYLSLFFAGSQYLLVIRSLRLLRTARILKLTHFIKEGELLGTALRASVNKILVFLGVVLTLVVIIGSLMFLIEGRENGFTSIPTSIYWTIVTLTTVGYGDISPQTPLGQALASLVMIMGYGIIAVPTGIVTVELSNVGRKEISTIPCPNCNKRSHEAGAHFCSNCGYQLLS
ncbi:MAG: ion transporter [Hymenobacteraceae bacterium]|nr:ion transporter [Hymenobacteraceae bacterium]MDX5395033.1 ion transporter [Hymenobacteraceae bacterium]MDX5443511.1 ion transporter [Hymenobacteraceae bacterium]MDX5511067.1 ion transporter [Hymenobacteraceae bacterium]